MATWEPIDGVYLKTPLVAAPEDGWPLTYFVTAAGIILVLALIYVISKHRQPGWRLGQQTLLLGWVLTLLYFVLISYIWSHGASLLSMPLNEVGDFFAGAFGPVAFLWLLLGYHKQIENLSLEKDRLYRADFSLYALPRRTTNLDAHHVIEVKNQGNIATAVSLDFRPPINTLRFVELGDYPTGHEKKDLLQFSPVESAEGKCWVNYTDAAGARRVELFKYAIDGDRLVFEKEYMR